jgi:hypothetical protein
VAQQVVSSHIAVRQITMLDMLAVVDIIPELVVGIGRHLR